MTESRTTLVNENHEPALANRLLVVDDQEVNRDLLMRRLERRGFRVWTAKDGQEAL